MTIAFIIFIYRGSYTLNVNIVFFLLKLNVNIVTDTKTACTKPRGCQEESLAQEGMQNLITLFTSLEHNLFYLFIGRFCVQAYVQQLETSRLKLIHLEQELDRARQQV